MTASVIDFAPRLRESTEIRIATLRHEAEALFQDSLQLRTEASDLLDAADAKSIASQAKAAQADELEAQLRRIDRRRS